jgi:AcrR family transcriptional regulator
MKSSPPSPASPRSKGRPRAFDPDEALDAALRVFWKQGYEGTSMSDLTEAMGINRPSLYAAFGNKEELFAKALDRYSADQNCFMTKALGESTARGVAERLLHGVVEMLCDPATPTGCLMVQGALCTSEAAESVRQALAARRKTGQTAIQERLKRAAADGDLPRGSRPEDLARYLTTIMQGLSIQASSGASKKELRRVADLALEAWPR